MVVSHEKRQKLCICTRYSVARVSSYISTEVTNGLMGERSIKKTAHTTEINKWYKIGEAVGGNTHPEHDFGYALDTVYSRNNRLDVGEMLTILNLESTIFTHSLQIIEKSS